MGDSQNIINLEDGWNVEIKKKALDPLEVSTIRAHRHWLVTSTAHVSSSYLLMPNSDVNGEHPSLRPTTLTSAAQCQSTGYA